MHNNGNENINNDMCISSDTPIATFEEVKIVNI